MSFISPFTANASPRLHSQPSLPTVQFGMQATHTQPAKDSIHISGPASAHDQKLQALIRAFRSLDGDTKIRQLLEHLSPQEQTTLLVRASQQRAITDLDGWTPLHWAAEIDNPEAVTALVNAGAKVDQSDYGENTPLHVATHYSHSKSTAALIKAGAKLDQHNDRGLTPLHLAAERGHCDALTTLINAGTKLDQLSKTNGWTPLHSAASGGRPDAIITLIKAGAKVNQHTKSGLTPLQCLQINVSKLNLDQQEDRARYLEAARYLITYGADPEQLTPKFRDECIPQPVKQNKIGQALQQLLPSATASQGEPSTEQLNQPIHAKDIDKTPKIKTD